MRAGLVVLVLFLVASKAHAVTQRASTSPPGGISNPPQFILFSHDDAMNSDAYKYVVTDVTKKHKNPNNCTIKATLFGCTSACGFSCSTAVKLYQEGHEVATHTVNHKDMRGLSYSQVKKEIVGARDKIVGCGVPASEVQGFRTPFLSDYPTIRKVLFNNGFSYDSTIGAKGGRNRQWPATMERGVPYDCSVADQLCSSSERYPGMWEVPLYELPDKNLMDVCTDESTGSPRSGCSVYGNLKKSFDDAYGSNRAPVTVGVHSVTTGFLVNSRFRSDVNKFFKYALAKPDVWAVTHRQLLDWMQAPVNATQMATFMSRYTC